MNYNELREVGKIWILMGVFSTCFFASCSQNPTSPPESVTLVTHTKPVSHDMEPRQVNMDSEYDSVDSYSEDLEGSGYSEPDYDSTERDESAEYPDDIPRPQPRATNTDRPTQEVSSNTQETPNAEVALNAPLASESKQADPPASPETPSSAEDTHDDDDTSPFLVGQIDDDTDANDYSADYSNDEDRG